jgi:hypothetical protein
MARIFRITIELRPVGIDSEHLEFAVTEKIRTAKEREICFLQLGRSVEMNDIAILQQIVDDVVLSATSRTVGNQEQLTF